MGADAMSIGRYLIEMLDLSMNWSDVAEMVRGPHADGNWARNEVDGVRFGQPARARESAVQVVRE